MKIIKIRIQVLNGNNVIKQFPIDDQVEISSSEELEKYRAELKNKYRDSIISDYLKEHPGADRPKLDVLFTIKS